MTYGKPWYVASMLLNVNYPRFPHPHVLMFLCVVLLKEFSLPSFLTPHPQFSCSSALVGPEGVCVSPLWEEPHDLEERGASGK